MPGPPFEELVAAVEETAGSGEALDRLATATTLGAALADQGDALVTHFVDECRAAGHTWAEIGASLGVTRQAAQKRYAGGTLDRVTPRTQEVLVAAREIADDQGASALRLDHLLLAVFSQPQTVGAKVLAQLGVTRESLDETIATHTRAPGARLSEVAPVDQALLSTALAHGHNYIGTEHILLACHRDPVAPWARALDDVGAPASAVEGAVLAALGTR